jgi:hypothetical protein
MPVRVDEYGNIIEKGQGSPTRFEVPDITVRWVYDQPGARSYIVGECLLPNGNTLYEKVPVSDVQLSMWDDATKQAFYDDILHQMIRALSVKAAKAMKKQNKYDMRLGEDATFKYQTSKGFSGSSIAWGGSNIRWLNTRIREYTELGRI